MSDKNYPHDAAIGLMNFLADAHDWDFWLSASTGRLSMHFGSTPAGLSRDTVLALLAVVRPECERVLAMRVPEPDAVQ
jgi:hypothetical protein